MWPESSLNIGGSYWLWCLLFTVNVLLSWVLSLKKWKKIQGAHFFNLFPVYFCLFFKIYWNLCLLITCKMLLWQELMQDYNELFVRGRHPEPKYAKEDTGVFKTLHPVGPAPSWCWGAVKATEDKFVSVPSLSSVIINTITANHFLNHAIKYLLKIILQ